VRIADLMDSPAAYRFWQAPFVLSKMRPLLHHNDVGSATRVLDVGCGPGTNVACFAHADYVGLDMNPRYVAYARRRYGRDFRVADVTRLSPSELGRFDFVLVNSLLHHLDLSKTNDLLEILGQMLKPEGHVHVLDLVLPWRLSMAYLLARLDRGPYARPAVVWQDLLSRHFLQKVFEVYVVGPGLWWMVYFKGARLR
jgi:SAM-dependent methyltransferase